MTYATDIDPAPLHGAMPHRLAARHAAARAHRQPASPAPGSRRRSTIPARSTRPSATTIRCCGAAARQLARLLRRRDRRLRRAARPAGHGVPARRLAGAAAHRGRRDVQLRRHRARARRCRRRAAPSAPRSAATRSRSSCRATASSAARARSPATPAASIARPRCCASRPSASAPPPRRAPAGASLRPRDVAELLALAALWGGVVPLHAHRRAGVRAGRARLPARRRRRPAARAAARGARRARARCAATGGRSRSSASSTRRCRSSASPTRRCRSTPACRRSSTRRRRSSPRSSPGSGSATA